MVHSTTTQDNGFTTREPLDKCLNRIKKQLKTHHVFTNKPRLLESVAKVALDQQTPIDSESLVTMASRSRHSYMALIQTHFDADNVGPAIKENDARIKLFQPILEKRKCSFPSHERYGFTFETQMLLLDMVLNEDRSCSAKKLDLERNQLVESLVWSLTASELYSVQLRIATLFEDMFNGEMIPSDLVRGLNVFYSILQSIDGKENGVGVPVVFNDRLMTFVVDKKRKNYLKRSYEALKAIVVHCILVGTSVNDMEDLNTDTAKDILLAVVTRFEIAERNTVPHSTLVGDMEALLESNTGELEIFTGVRTIRARRDILACNSDWFYHACYITKEYTSSSNPVINLNDWAREETKNPALVSEKVLRYLYTGQVGYIDPVNAFDCYIAGEYFMLDYKSDFMCECRDVIIESINDDNYELYKSLAVGRDQDPNQKLFEAAIVLYNE